MKPTTKVSLGIIVLIAVVSSFFAIREWRKPKNYFEVNGVQLPKDDGKNREPHPIMLDPKSADAVKHIVVRGPDGRILPPPPKFLPALPKGVPLPPEPPPIDLEDDF